MIFTKKPSTPTLGNIQAFLDNTVSTWETALLRTAILPGPEAGLGITRCCELRGYETSSGSTKPSQNVFCHPWMSPLSPHTGQCQ